MNFNLKDTAKEKMIIVAHRGNWSGNIPCNTMGAYKIALTQGADMIEIDVDRSRDGELFIFHPGMERVLLYSAEKLKNLDSQDVKKLRYVNSDCTPTQYGLSTLDEVLEEFKGKCYINIDKFWDNPKQIAEKIRRHNMMDQILVKTSVKSSLMEVIEENCPDVQYMAIVSDPEEIEIVKKHKLNYIGNEVLFKTDDHVFATKEFIEKQHSLGYLVWCNAIVYNYRSVLAGGHNDDISLIDDPQKGWGWIADRGYDFMQTDWTMMAIDYLKNTGRYFR